MSVKRIAEGIEKRRRTLQVLRTQLDKAPIRSCCAQKQPMSSSEHYMKPSTSPVPVRSPHLRLSIPQHVSEVTTVLQQEAHTLFVMACWKQIRKQSGRSSYCWRSCRDEAASGVARPRVIARLRSFIVGGWNAGSSRDKIYPRQGTGDLNMPQMSILYTSSSPITPLPVHSSNRIDASLHSSRSFQSPHLRNLLFDARSRSDGPSKGLIDEGWKRTFG